PPAKWPPPNPLPPKPLASAALEARPAVMIVAAVARVRMTLRDMVVLRGLSFQYPLVAAVGERFMPMSKIAGPARHYVRSHANSRGFEEARDGGRRSMRRIGACASRRER